ncbi:MAG TPA: rhomboid family intramembrane serine protease, partial [Thermoanaerobaculia bacterium]|nr:rhomboid family intramembrane serine protease [Thermoanaerobaculia bacterium]
ARIVAMFPIFFYPIFFQVPAFIYLGFWFLTQFFSGTLAIATQREVSGIAWWAHVGGFGAGILTFWLFLRPRKSPPPIPGSFA